jgi:hypothetical protein
MGVRKRYLPLAAVAAGVLALGSGCATDDTNKSTSNRPDVLQPGVLPPPQSTLNAAPGVVPAGGVQAAAPVVAAPAASGPTLPKINLRPEKKVIATEMAVAWRPKIEYLPDPTRNGAMGAGLAGQLFLFGGQKLEFAQADGVLTVDLVDDTPRLPGQPAATPERWQFNKEMLRNLRTTDDTFGKSYVLFLPWPAYKPDITRVKISARYDPDNGYTLFCKPEVVTLFATAPVWDGTAPSGPAGNPTPTPPSNIGNPIPIGGAAPNSPFAPAGAIPPGVIPLGALVPGTSGVAPLGPTAPVAPLAPAGGPPSGIFGR